MLSVIVHEYFNEGLLLCVPLIMLFIMVIGSITKMNSSVFIIIEIVMILVTIVYVEVQLLCI